MINIVNYCVREVFSLPWNSVGITTESQMLFSKKYETENINVSEIRVNRIGHKIIPREQGNQPPGRENKGSDFREVEKSKLEIFYLRK